MEKKTEIKRIVLQLGKKEISLTVDEAKKLKELLSEMFGKEVIKEIRTEHHYDKYWWNFPPTVSVFRAPEPNPNPYKFFCSAGNIEFKDNTVYCSA